MRRAPGAGLPRARGAPAEAEATPAGGCRTAHPFVRASSSRPALCVPAHKGTRCPEPPPSPSPAASPPRYLLVFRKQSVNLLKQLAELDPSSMSGPGSRGDEKEKKAPRSRRAVPLPPGPSPPRIPSPRAAAAAAPRKAQDHGREAAAGRRSRGWCCRGPAAAERNSEPWMEGEEKSLLLPPPPPGWAIK